MRRVTLWDRAGDFIIDQVKKTVRHPSRIFAIPLRRIRKTLVEILTFPPLVPLHRTLLRWFPRALQKFAVQLDFIEGTLLLDRNRPREAYAAFSRCLEHSRDPHHFFTAAACLLVGLGRFREAMAIFTRANDLRLQQARSFGQINSRLRYLPTIWYGNFGHLAQTDYLIKLNILEGRAKEETVLYVAPGTVAANRFLFDQWRPFLKVVERATDLPLPEEQMKALEFDFLAPRLADGRTVQLWEIAGRTYQRWHASGRGPILSLPSDIEEQGWHQLQSVGIPRDGWFVVLHVRERVSKSYHAKLHNVLNARIDDYRPAIEEITRRGGWVVRIGDPKMTSLESMPNVFDYCHSNVRSDWMDIFLCARARFFLGTSSGPAYVPPIYGVPAVLTNWWPPAQRPWHASDIFIPKLCRCIADGRLLSLDESLAEPFGYCNSVAYLAEAEGVIVEDNEPEDIRLAVVEMFERFDGRLHDGGEVRALRQRADEIYERHNAIGNAALARAFLRKHLSLLS
jgi:putative glycosyltransferase (TIGR04372 family)